MNIVSKIFKNKKTLPLNIFLEKILYNKKYGYYSKKNPFGIKGDFITSPMVSKLFGEIIGIWCIAFWERLGFPKKIKIVEMGPGNGKLSLTLMSVFSNFKKFNESFELILLEKSEKLKKEQMEKLNSKKVKWIKSLKEIKNGPIIFLSNEFFDALPIKQFIKKKNLLYERYVENIDNKKIIFCDKKNKSKILNKKIYKNFFKHKNFIEFPVDAIKLLEIISKKLKKFNGGIIFFDYGYFKNKTTNTLQSIKKHKYSNVLKNLGNSDITHLIDFDFFSFFLKKNGLQLEGITEQGAFLKKMGIIERANIISKNMTFKEKSDLFYRLKRLIDEKEMGGLFKVLFFKKKGLSFNLGFK